MVPARAGAAGRELRRAGAGAAAAPARPRPRPPRQRAARPGCRSRRRRRCDGSGARLPPSQASSAPVVASPAAPGSMEQAAPGRAGPHLGRRPPHPSPLAASCASPATTPKSAAVLIPVAMTRPARAGWRCFFRGSRAPPIAQSPPCPPSPPCPCEPSCSPSCPCESPCSASCCRPGLRRDRVLGLGLDAQADGRRRRWSGQGRLWRPRRGRRGHDDHVIDDHVAGHDDRWHGGRGRRRGHGGHVHRRRRRAIGGGSPRVPPRQRRVGQTTRARHQCCNCRCRECHPSLHLPSPFRRRLHGHDRGGGSVWSMPRFTRRSAGAGRRATAGTGPRLIVERGPDLVARPAPLRHDVRPFDPHVGVGLHERELRVGCEVVSRLFAIYRDRTRTGRY